MSAQPEEWTEASDEVVDAARPWPGRWTPLGATADDEGTNFALWADEAERVEVCLFDEDGREQRIPLDEQTFHVWHGYLPGVRPGQRYGFRVHGPWDPASGHRFNPAKLLTDPYARAVDGRLTYDDRVSGHVRGGPKDTRDDRDSAPFVPRSVVVRDDFDWGGDAPPRIEWQDTVVYEAHVRGLTARHPDVPEHQRGTYAGLAHPAVVNHLTWLGVTAVELLPVHHFITEEHLARDGKVNYWGYNSLGYFAPESAYSSTGSLGGQVSEFKAMVKTLHAAGLEVILDVVYNHTAEGGADGPTLAFRGLGNASYYKLAGDRRGYADYTGCGNTLDLSHPHVLQLVMDSLRYWVQEMHVDGFRFDLASALARSLHDVDMLSGFLTTIQQDPVLSQVKLIAEPWDVGDGGYQVGEFPPLWSEWNDQYRDTVRDFWRGQTGGLRGLGYRLSGSSDLYADDGRRPFSSVNFVTAHDGFTLRDLVTYNDKHNEANGEDNRDGTDNNRSWNHGVEGETDDESILGRATSDAAQPARHAAALHRRSHADRGRRDGAHPGRQQQRLLPGQRDLLGRLGVGAVAGRPARVRPAPARRCAAAHPALRHRHFFEGRSATEGGAKDLGWFGARRRRARRRGLVRQPRRRRSGCTSPATRSTSVRRAASQWSTPRSCCCCTPVGDPVEFTLPGAPWAVGYRSRSSTPRTSVPARATRRSRPTRR